MIGVSHPLIYFPLYEKSKIYFKENWDKDNSDPDKLSSRYVAISTIWCKAATSFLTYPHEVLRARMQDTRKYEMKDIPIEQRTKNSLFGTAKQLYKEKGILSFYDGFWINLMRISPSYAITFVLYE